jgi:hypothetical protein
MATIKELESKISDLEAKLEKAKSALKFYADEYNYTIDDYYGISGEMKHRCILYKDLEERNECYAFAGKLARQTLKDIGE